MSESQLPPIILLHGWGMNRGVWQQILPKIEETFERKVIALDLPGFGNNSQLPEHYSLDALVSWLAEVAPPKASIVAWSLSGLIAIEYARLHPQRVASLGLVATSPKFVEQGSWPGIKPQVLQAFAKQLQVSHEKTIERFMAIQAMGTDTAKQDIKRVKDNVMALPTPNSVALEKGLELLECVDLRNSVQALKLTPRLLLGRLDSLVPAKMASQLVNYNANIEVTVLDKASHAPFISHPEAFIDWLKGLQ